ncbi:hypothetical protein [Allokutzneria oryzae]|uniref:Uncharacterized protein n=1 Tax=Allokutzneria oryzae TaxID=1378989 RepID=A0ABV5ZS28_9PSEU
MSKLFSFTTARALTAEELSLTASDDAGRYDAESQTWVGSPQSTAVPCTVTNFYPYNRTTIGDYWTGC